MDDGLRFLHPLMQRLGALELERIRRRIPLRGKPAQKSGPMGREKVEDLIRLLLVALVRAPAKAWREAHLHLRIRAPGKRRIGMKILDASAQQEKIQHLFRISLRPGARGEWTKERMRHGLADSCGWVNPGIGILDRHAQKSRRPQAQAAACSIASAIPKDPQRRVIEAERGLEFRARGAVLDALHHVRQLQPAGLRTLSIFAPTLRRAQKSHEAAAQVLRFAEIRLRRRIGGKQSEDAGPFG